MNVWSEEENTIVLTIKACTYIYTHTHVIGYSVLLTESWYLMRLGLSFKSCSITTISPPHAADIRSFPYICTWDKAMLDNTSTTSILYIHIRFFNTIHRLFHIISYRYFHFILHLQQHCWQIHSLSI